MAKQGSTQEVASLLAEVSTATIKRLAKRDKHFPAPKRIGRSNYHDMDKLQAWLKTRATNPDAIRVDDKIISGACVLEMVGRSKAWLWRNIIKPKKLTRINLSPDPQKDKLSNYFIEREIRESYGDLIEVSNLKDRVGV